jgi:uncharacterized membrane protein
MPEPTDRPGVPDHVSQTVDTIAQLHARSEEDVTRHQRSIEMIAANLGKPRALYMIGAAALMWVVMNVAMCASGRSPFDPPPFSWLQGFASLGALLMATTVLATQNRQRKISDERAQLDLQVNLLSEQKLAKVIALLEELRRDMPNVKNRSDPLAEAMTQAVDPHAVVTALQETMEDATTKHDKAST